MLFLKFNKYYFSEENSYFFPYLSVTNLCRILNLVSRCRDVISYFAKPCSLHRNKSLSTLATHTSTATLSLMHLKPSGKRHDFLGMNIEIKDRQVHINMQEQVQVAIEWGHSQGGCKPPNPATSQLFSTDLESEVLSDDDSDLFHSIVQKLLYICKRARPDIEPVVSYLCTRVSSSSKEDDTKLTRVLGFLEKTINDERIIGATDLNTLYTWVDASYGVHPDMKSHTGGNMSYGLGTLHTKSLKQKLNRKSSTEAELVGVSEYLPYNIWMTNFLEKQGYKPTSNVIYQDNQSAMCMEINGRNSCTGNSRHIDIRYFFVKDIILVEHKKDLKHLCKYNNKGL